MMPALTSPTMTLPPVTQAPHSAAKAYSEQTPVTFKSLLDSASTPEIDPADTFQMQANADVEATFLSPEFLQELSPEKTLDHTGSTNATLATIPSLLPAPNGTLALFAVDSLDEYPVHNGSEPEPIADISINPVLTLLLLSDPKSALHISFETNMPTEAADDSEAAIQIALNPKAILPAADFTSVAGTLAASTFASGAQQSTVISSSIFTINTEQVFTGRQLDLARDHLWLDRLASDIVAAREFNDKVSFRLLPPRLGQLDVEICTLRDGLSVNMTATNEEAGKIVAAAQPRLIDELRSQGMRVHSAEITYRDMPQHDGRQSNPRTRQTTEFATPPNTETADTEAAQVAGRFA
jgi:flagellar hook-length control protein FliK